MKYFLCRNYLFITEKERFPYLQERIKVPPYPWFERNDPNRSPNIGGAFLRSIFFVGLLLLAGFAYTCP